MTEFARTPHAVTRMRQRGLRDADVALMMSAATPLAKDAWLMTDTDVAREITKRKREIQQFERLRHVKMVVVGSDIVTAYHSRRRLSLSSGCGSPPWRF
jgi:hypothetical protein